MQIQIAGTEPGFKLWAIVSSMALAVMCMLAGACVMHMQSLAEVYDMDFKTGVKLGMRFGLAGFAIAWCGYMVLLAFAASTPRFRAGFRFAMLTWVLIACGVLALVIHGWFGTMFSGMRSVM